MSLSEVMQISGATSRQQMRNLYQISFLLMILASLIPYATADWDPYEVIGVKRDANLDQIKKTYRELARKLHPDKSNLDEGEAERKFIELNKAFNILKDPEKRNRYDLHGETDENRSSRGYNGGRRRRDHWAQRGARTFTFNRKAEEYLRRKSITSRQYRNDYVKESKYRIFFVFFYTDFFPSWDLVDPTWSKITDELAKFNIGSFAINVHREPRLSQELGISSVTQIACLIDGQVKFYYESELSLKNIVKFTRNLLPYNLVPLLRTEVEQDRFITSSPQQNRLSAIIIHNGESLKLRYLLIAYEFRQYYRFAHISTKLSDYTLIASNYNLSIEPASRKANFLVFDEYIKSPIINIKFDEESYDTNQLRKQLTRWPFLRLPKLFSQQRFDDLCIYTIPKNGDHTKTRLCVILFATDTPSTIPARNKFVEFMEANKLVRDDKVVFAYLDPLKQTEFVSSIISETKNTYPFHGDAIDMSVIIIERNTDNPRKAHYKWLDVRWDPRRPDSLDKAKVDLYQLIDGYKMNLKVLHDKVALSSIFDEEGPSLMDRVFWRFFDSIMRVIYYLTSRESFSTVVVLILCALITSLCLYQFPQSLPTQAEPESMQNSNEQPKREASVNHHQNPSHAPTTRIYSEEELKIIELKAETYNGMVRLLKPGYRSIVLLGDRETKDTLLPEFKKAVWPYRRNKTLLFGYMCLDQNLAWYKSLLEEVLAVNDLNVNKKYCIGTVLSLNGFKRYFRVYHAKHHEIDYYDNETDNDGSFLGFGDDDDGDPDEDFSAEDLERNRLSRPALYTVDRLLDRLPIWLDKMFDGLTKRYFVDNWPEEMT